MIDFDKEEKKFNRYFAIIVGIVVVSWIVIFISLNKGIDNAFNNIESRGGVGTMIGNFLRDIEEAKTIKPK